MTTYPQGLPHIAYILLWYPLFTQPFIFREVEYLKKELPLKVYTLYGQNLRCCSREMLNTATSIRHYGVKSLFPVIARSAIAYGFDPKLTWRIFRDAMFHKWPSLEVLGENLWAYFVGMSLGRQIKEDGMDLIYAPWPRGAATAAWVASRLSGIPFAISARGDNLAPADPDLPQKFSAASIIRANNAADKRRIEEFPEAKGKTRLVYNSLTLAGSPIAEPSQVRKPPRLLAVGRFDVTKGFDILLKACHLLDQQGLDFHLTLVGGGGKVMGLGNLENELRSLREELGLTQKVSMPGLVSHDNLPKLLQEHDLFVAPCVIHESGRRDGIPNTVIEAMAYGMPIISTNINALPEVIINGETGLSVEQKDPQALARAIAWMVAHPVEARQMGINAASRARQLFDPAQNAKKLAQIFMDWKETVKCAE